MSEDEKIPSLLGNHSLKLTLVATFIGQLILTIISFFANIWLGLLLLLIFIVSWILMRYFLEQYEEKLATYISRLTYRIKRSEQEAMIKMPLGIILYNNQYEINWINPYLQSQLNTKESLLGKAIQEIHEPLMAKIEKDETNQVIEWEDKVYQLEHQEDIQAIYLMDITEYIKIRREYEHYQPVIGWLFLDNYDEVIKSLDDRTVSNLNSLLTTYLSNWANQHSLYYKKVSTDKYLLLFSYDELKRLEDGKFSIIDNIRDRTSKRNAPLTISIGLAYGKEDFSTLADIAQQNLDLALGRGGDQAIVKSSTENPRYYGGRTNPMEKRTRVRSRMISQALQEQMQEAEHIYVMGHSAPDMDAIGSSFGIARIAMMLKQEVSVVINQNDLSSDIQKLLAETEKYDETYKNIISPKEAKNHITENDLIVLVDHHKPTLSIAPDLLEKTSKKVIIDHHRRGEEFIDNPLLVYIEPYASSASELITEFFEYIQSEGNQINKIEATAMLAGIIVDTNNFSSRTGSRTFDAASFLQSVGANLQLIQRMLKEDVDHYLKRSQIIKTVDFVCEGHATATGPDNEIIDPVITAQAADTMLSMSDIEASFVITRRSKNTVGISARSLGSINVQLIMERLGGGGHLSNAATQIDHKTVEEVKEELTEVIKEMNN